MTSPPPPSMKNNLVGLAGSISNLTKNGGIPSFFFFLHFSPPLSFPYFFFPHKFSSASDTQDLFLQPDSFSNWLRLTLQLDRDSVSGLESLIGPRKASCLLKLILPESFILLANPLLIPWTNSDSEQTLKKAPKTEESSLSLEGASTTTSLESPSRHGNSRRHRRHACETI